MDGKIANQERDMKVLAGNEATNPSLDHQERHKREKEENVQIIRFIIGALCVALLLSLIATGLFAACGVLSVHTSVNVNQSVHVTRDGFRQMYGNGSGRYQTRV
eukprot:GDKI01006735.1.p3 GENE.GDKI01006735.1~~GDKI01006735.1.p3  ORF type:complete len:104 (-),score=10.50 GDKI01006735.1:57-368(-)